MNSIVITTFCVLLTYTRAARILFVAPTPSISHQLVFRALSQELARRGHDVVIITPDPVFTNNEAPANLTEVDVREVSYAVWKELIETNTAIGKKQDLITTVALFLQQFRKVLETQLKTEEVKRIIRGEMGAFNLVIVEAVVRPALGFSHIFKVPLIQLSSFSGMLNSNDITGAPSHPFLYPWILSQRVYGLTVWEKMQELMNYVQLRRLYASYEAAEIEMLRRVVDPKMPDYSELYGNVDLLFHNSHPMWSDNQPVPANVVYIRGIHKYPQKDLPQDLKAYLDAAKNGVIYVSFGNNLTPSLLPAERVQMLTKVFSELPCNIVWRWDVDVPNRPANVKIMHWVPQTDLLRHPNIKLFITQGGLQSTEESIEAGVPLIGIPMLADQWYNVEKYLHFKIGKKLDMGTSTEEEFRTAIMSVLEDKSYRENVIKLRDLLNDQPESGLARAVWWTEYVLRHGGAKHLRAPAANMPAAQYYEIPLVLTILTLFCIALTSIGFLLYGVWKVSYGRVKVKQL